MGIYDRDYYGGEYGNGFGARRMSFGGRSMVITLIILNVAVFVLNLFVGTGQDTLMRWLSLSPNAILKPWLWWKLLTYGFAHDPRGLSHIGWNMFGLWMFGRAVEEVYGRWEFLRIYLTAVVLGGLGWCLHQTVVARGMDIPPSGGAWGASAAVTAVILLFVFHFPRRTLLLFFVLPVPAWVVGVLIIGGDLLGILSPASPDPTLPRVAYDAHLAGAAFACCYFYFRWNLARPFSIFSRLGGLGSLFKRRPKLRIHAPDKYEQLEARADVILAKVEREGLDSLTAKERRILEQYSRMARKKRGMD